MTGRRQTGDNGISQFRVSPLPSNEKVGTADQGGRINLGQSRAGNSFRLVEQGSQLILEPFETEHLPTSEAWLFRNKDALASVRRGLEQAAAGNLVEGPDLHAAHALAMAIPPCRIRSTQQKRCLSPTSRTAPPAPIG
jgi:hypothetical protein